MSQSQNSKLHNFNIFDIILDIVIHKFKINYFFQLIP
jgi:hypothetical protein